MDRLCAEYGDKSGFLVTMGTEIVALLLVNTVLLKEAQDLEVKDWKKLHNFTKNVE